MRILYAVHAYKPAYRVGGPVTSVSAVAEKLVRKGHNLIVFTTNSNLDQDLEAPLNQRTEVDGVEVWYFRRTEPLQKWLPFIPYLSRSMGFLYCPEMRKALDAIAPSVDLVNTQIPFVYPTFAAAHAAFRHQKPLFYHQRGSFNPGGLRFRGAKKRLYIAAVERPIMRRATTLIGLTEAERVSFRSLRIETPCEVVPNGIEVPSVPTGASERVEQRFGISPHVLVVLFLSRLHPTKGADKLLEAFIRATTQCSDAILVMAGPDEWGMEAEWRERIASHSLTHRVIFPGMLMSEDKADILARADLFCLPSMVEGFSMAVLEALSHRTAVMLSPGCNFPEVETAGAGRVVPAEPAAMTAMLIELLSDRDRLRFMGAAGRRLVSENYSWDVITDRLLDVYEEGIKRFQQSHASLRRSPETSALLR